MAQIQTQIQRQQNQEPKGKIIFLNALPLNAFQGHVRLDVLPVSLNDLVRWVYRRLEEGYQLESFIRHESTVKLLQAISIPLPGSNLGNYRYRHGDILVVVTLRNPARGQEASQLTPEDLAVWVVTVS